MSDSPYVQRGKIISKLSLVLDLVDDTEGNTLISPLSLSCILFLEQEENMGREPSRRSSLLP